MSRILKYQCWDTESKTMFQVEGFTFPQKPAFRGSVFDGDNEIPWQNRCILREFTGLKDKNGVEIYEGDVVNCGIGEIRQVKYNSQCTSFRYYSFRYNISWEMLQRDVSLDKVIGNIYENPELLEG